MSYILDALKKSEQQRGHGTTPGIQTIHSSSLSYRNEKRTLWPYILIAAVILNLAAIIYFITDKNTGSDNKIQQMQSPINNNEQPVIVSTKPAPAIAKAEPEKTVIPSNNQQTQAETPTTVASTPTPSTTKEKTHAAEHTEEKIIKNTENPVIDYHELPESTKQQLPAIIISAHVYSSNPLQRSIVINNNFMEEGEYVLDDLILHEITAEGAIFDYNNQLFHYGVISGWQ